MSKARISKNYNRNFIRRTPLMSPLATALLASMTVCVDHL